MGRWDEGKIYHLTADGQPVTVKVTADGRDALIARGHHADLQRVDKGGPDHVHIWDLQSGDFRLHDMYVSASLVPNIRDDRRNPPTAESAARFDALISRAEAVATGRIDRQSIEQAKALQAEWRQLGQSSPAQYHAFRAQIDAIFAANRERIEVQKRDWARNRDLKESVVRRAEGAVEGRDLKAAGEEMKRLFDEWKSIGPCDRRDADALWVRFQRARDRLRERRDQETRKRQAEWSANRFAKERLVSQAESLANSSDLKVAGDRMKPLMDEWKRIGPCERSDNERLWQRFQAAREKLRDRKQREFNARKQAWAANKAAKQTVVSQMVSLVHTNDYRAAKDRARQLSDQWRAIGPCEKADNDRLWSEFKTAKDRLFEAAKRDGDKRKAEARQRAQERVYRLEEQLRNVEAAIYRANESYSRALSARSPSFKNPNFSSIMRNQQMRQSAAREKIVSLGQRKNEIISRLGEARSRLNQF